MRRSGRAQTPKTSAPLLAALGDETRLGLVAQLCQHGPLSISRLTEGSDITRQAITKHLRVLAEVGLAHARRDGRESLWELRPDRLDEARRYLGQISRQWDDAIIRLKSFVES